MTLRSTVSNHPANGEERLGDEVCYLLRSCPLAPPTCPSKWANPWALLNTRSNNDEHYLTFYEHLVCARLHHALYSLSRLNLRTPQGQQENEVVLNVTSLNSH